MTSIPYGKQHITEDDLAAVAKALQSDYLTQGPTIKLFEDAFASYVGAKFAVAVSNGTAALHLSALAIGVDSQTNVITTPITFAASANCIRYCGGNVWFADIDPINYTLDLKKTEELILSKPPHFFNGIIPVDFAGYPIDLEAFRRLADKHGLWIIEDSCHAPGGSFIDSASNIQRCGNGSYADLAIFSFHPVKHIATGEGGMITTNNPDLYKKLLLLRSHGITRDASQFTNSSEFAAGSSSDAYPGWYMEMQELGYNYRFTDFQSALGISQLKRANQGLEKRRKIAETYAEAFANATFITGQSGVVEGHAYHLYVIETDRRLELYEFLKIKQIFTQVHYIPCHLMPYYRQLGWNEGALPIAENYYKQCLSLPIYPTLTDAEQQYVIEAINNFFNA
jgi:UDP-4-amino-4,6-dideoxy-N-acetyl-beta-L-altrosamine transaminase